jgi:hypothetical protein
MKANEAGLSAKLLSAAYGSPPIPLPGSERCAACSVAGPGVEHHFWTCPVAVAVREEMEDQLRAQ